MKSIFKSLRVLLAIFLAVAIDGCASAPQLTGAGAGARSITPNEAKECKFIRVVQYNDRIISLGKDPTVMKAIGETNLRNQIGAAGGNAYVTTKNDSNWFMGSVSYQAEAYSCAQ